MKKFELLEDHEKLNNLNNRVKDLQKINKVHQQLNGKLNITIKDLQEDLKIKDKESGRMMTKINLLESKIK